MFQRHSPQQQPQQQQQQQQRYSSLPHHHSDSYRLQQEPDYSSAPKHHYHHHHHQQQQQQQQQLQRDLSPTTRQQLSQTTTKQRSQQRRSSQQQLLLLQQQQQQQKQQQQQQQQQPQQQQQQHQQYPELQIIFDFFTDNPQKVMPGDVNSPKKDSPYFDPYWESIRAMQENDSFLEGVLLRSVDCKPRFPYVHYIVYKEESQRTRKASDQDNGRHQIEGDFIEVLKNRGAYKELHTFVDKETSLLPKRPSNPNTAYILSAFMTSGSNLESLDRTWSYWSGADYIVENIPPSLKLERITFHKMINPSPVNPCSVYPSKSSAAQEPTHDAGFTSWPPPAPHNGTSLSLSREVQTENSGPHHRFSTQPSPLQQGAASYDPRKGQNTGVFSYVLLCELGEALADINRAREFIDHLKFRQCGISSLYVIDHFF